mmetsp:Transcript_11273/g.22769  ORF Transcript_11273/g.22769 Transcript_11273/m.22769 type:complete len:96 (+) Transcript_11273:1400-1687(+)
MRNSSPLAAFQTNVKTLSSNVQLWIPPGVLLALCCYNTPGFPTVDEIQRYLLHGSIKFDSRSIPSVATHWTCTNEHSLKCGIPIHAHEHVTCDSS